MGVLKQLSNVSTLKAGYHAGSGKAVTCIYNDCNACQIYYGDKAPVQIQAVIANVELCVPSDFSININGTHILNQMTACLWYKSFNNAYQGNQKVSILARAKEVTDYECYTMAGIIVGTFYSTWLESTWEGLTLFRRTKTYTSLHCVADSFTNQITGCGEFNIGKNGTMVVTNI